MKLLHGRPVGLFDHNLAPLRRDFRKRSGISSGFQHHQVAQIVQKLAAEEAEVPAERSYPFHLLYQCGCIPFQQRIHTCGQNIVVHHSQHAHDVFCGHLASAVGHQLVQQALRIAHAPFCAAGYDGENLRGQAQGILPVYLGQMLPDFGLGYYLEIEPLATGYYRSRHF